MNAFLVQRSIGILGPFLFVCGCRGENVTLSPWLTQTIFQKHEKLTRKHKLFLMLEKYNPPLHCMSPNFFSFSILLCWAVALLVAHGLDGESVSKAYSNLPAVGSWGFQRSVGRLTRLSCQIKSSPSFLFCFLGYLSFLVFVCVRVCLWTLCVSAQVSRFRIQQTSRLINIKKDKNVRLQHASSHLQW